MFPAKGKLLVVVFGVMVSAGALWTQPHSLALNTSLPMRPTAGLLSEHAPIHNAPNDPPLMFVPVTPCRVADTRIGYGVFGQPSMPARSIRTFPILQSSCAIPTGAQAYSLNITVAPHEPLGYLTTWPTGQPQPLVSTLNSTDGRVLANAAIVPAGINGAIDIYVGNETDVIIDINGYFTASGVQGLNFYTLSPCRVVDSRSAVQGQFGGPTLGAGAVRMFIPSQSACGIPAWAQAFAFNVTVVPYGLLGYLTAWPDGQTQPLVSTLNSLNGAVLANAAIVPAGASGGAKMYVGNKTELVVDANGYFGPATGGLSFSTVTPCRVADTRMAAGPFGGPALTQGARRSFTIPQSGCGVPVGAQAYSLNITAVPHGPLGYLTTWATGQPQPLASTLNAINGQVVANAAIVPAGNNGSIDLFASDDADVIIDVNGYFYFSGSSVQPAVTSVYPANQATGVALNSGVILSLNSAIDPASATAATVKLMNGSVSVAGTVSVSTDGLYVVFVPASSLLQSTTYTVQASGLTTPVSHAAVQAIVSSFATGTSSDQNYPTVITSPPNGATVPTNVRLAFQSSSRLNPASVGSTYFYDSGSYSSISVAVQIAPDGFTGTLTPLAPLGAGRIYSGGLYMSDIFGHSISAGFSFTLSFGVQTQGPTMISSGPGQGEVNMPLNTAVGLVFDRAISPLGLIAGIQLTSNGQQVPVRITLNPSGARVLITPLSLLAPSSTYTLATTNKIVDIAGNTLLNAGLVTFQTGTAIDLLVPAIVSMTPNGSVPLNAKIRALLNKRVNPASIDTGTMALQDASTYRAVPGNTSLSSDGLIATFTPTSPLTAGVQYQLTVNGFMDMSGTPFPQLSVYFTPGGAADTTAPSVLWSSPAPGASGVPVNTVLDVLLSETLDPTSVSTASITLAPGSPAAPLTFSTQNGNEITIRHSILLQPSTAYALSMNGLRDLAGNALPLFASVFTTAASSAADTIAPTVVSLDPVNHATGVAVNKVVTVTFSEPINPASASKVSFTAGNVSIPGTYAVSGPVMTFTPQGSWPGGTTISSYLTVTDYAGNTASTSYSFVTVSAVDTTPPAVTSVTPADGAAGLSANLSVVLTFSKPLDPTTVSSATFGLYNGNTRLSPYISRSADSKTVTITGYYLPAPATMTVVVTHDVKDLAGNPLPDFTSRFSTVARDLKSPTVITQRPGPGATGVAANTPVTLVLDKPLDPASLPSGFHVTQNGTPFPGAGVLIENGQAIRFTPSTSFQPGAVVQVFLDPTAVDTQGNPAQRYQGSFTIDSGLSTALSVVRINAYNLATNAVVDVEFNQDIDPTSLTAADIGLYKGNPTTTVPVTISLFSPRVVRLTPTASLTPNTSYTLFITAPLHSTTGNSFNNLFVGMYTTAGPDNTPWGLSGVAPGQGTGNLGTNAVIRIKFTKAADPLTVNNTTVRLSASGAAIPVNFSFSTDNRTLTITPTALLPDLSTVTLSVNGVQDLVGRSLSWSGSFTTGAAVDTLPPALLGSSISASASDVPINSTISMIFNEALDSTSITPDTCSISDGSYLSVAGSYSFSTDLRTVTFVPTAPFPVHRSISLYCWAVQDLAGNQSSSFSVGFTTSFSSDATPPQVIATNPDTGMNQAPINSQVQIMFNEPVQPTSLGSVSLTAGSLSVPITPVMIAPAIVGLNTITLLAPNTTYTLSIMGVRDLAGNQLAVPVMTTFSTGAGADLIAPSTTPAFSSGTVGTNTTIRLHFSERVNRVSVLSSFRLSRNDFYDVYGQDVPSVVSVSADGLSATLTPRAALVPNTAYSFFYSVTDLAGNTPYSSSYAFNTGLGPDNTGIGVSLLNPPNGTANVPVNASVSVLFTKNIDYWSAVTGITLTAGSTAVPWTLFFVGADTVRFTPLAPLAPSTTYTFRVSGVTDYLGNVCPTVTTSFTTGSSATSDITAPAVTTVSPLDGASAVAVSSTITVTYNEPLNPLSAKSVSIATPSGVTLASLIAVSGNSIVLTPSQPLPGNTTIKVTSSYVQDLAGNASGIFTSQFTTAAVVDQTPPTVTSVSPINGATGVSTYPIVVLTFSKPLDPATVTSSSIALLNGITPVSAYLTRSADSRTITLSPNNLPNSTLITVIATHNTADLSGNHLADFSSQFTTGVYSYSQAPYVTSQAPSSGSTNVPANTQIVLGLSAPMMVSTLPGAVHVSENGALLGGSVQIQGTQTLIFTSSRAFLAGSLIQVFLDSSALDATGLAASFYSGQFTVQGTSSPQALRLERLSPTSRHLSTRSVLEFEFNKSLAPDTVNAESVILEHRGMRVPASVTLRKGRIVRVAPRVRIADPLDPDYVVRFTSDLRTPDNESFAGQEIKFTQVESAAGAPEMISAERFGGGIRVRFTEAVNPLTVDSDSLEILGPEGRPIPSSISFSDDDRTVLMGPFAPLPDGNVTLRLVGVEGYNGEGLRDSTLTVSPKKDR